jgi:hypothetical protein
MKRRRGVGRIVCKNGEIKKEDQRGYLSRKEWSATGNGVLAGFEMRNAGDSGPSFGLSLGASGYAAALAGLSPSWGK